MKTKKYFFNLFKKNYPEYTDDQIKSIIEVAYFGYEKAKEEKKHGFIGKILKLLVKLFITFVIIFVVIMICSVFLHAPYWAALLTGSVWACICLL